MRHGQKNPLKCRQEENASARFVLDLRVQIGDKFIYQREGVNKGRFFVGNVVFGGFPSEITASLKA
jgi:hypothetical protein